MSWELVLYFGLGYVSGFIVGRILPRIRKDGVLRIDTSDPEKDLYSFEMHTGLDKVKTKKTLYLGVRVNRDSYNDYNEDK